MDIAFFGTGLMGQPMAARLIEQGHRLAVFNRDPAKTAALTARGAEACTDPAEALRQAEWAVTMLTDAAAIRQTLLRGAARDTLAGRRIINMATIAPQEARELHDAIAEAGGQFMECPVLGSIPEARAGTLILMFGGDAQQFAAAGPLLGAFGPKPLHVGTVGKASALKLAMNQLIASLTAAFSLSLGLIREEEVDVDTFMQVVRDSALYAPTFDKKLERMLTRNYQQPNFPVKHLLKDVRLFEQAAARDGLDGALIKALEHILEQTMSEGLADLDYSALYDTIHPQGG